MTRVVLGRRAQVDLEILSWRQTDTVRESIGLLERDPDAGKPLQGRLRGLFVLRVGSYRVLYEMVDNGHTVRILSIRHRSIAYRTDPR